MIHVLLNILQVKWELDAAIPLLKNTETVNSCLKMTLFIYLREHSHVLAATVVPKGHIDIYISQ